MNNSTSHSVQHSVDPPEPDPNLIRWLRENCVPIGGLSVGALMFCLVAHYGSITVDWTRTKDLTDAFANVTQAFALIAGGVWAYFKFAKGRTFRDRLIAIVNGKIVLIDGTVLLVVTTQIKNVGLAKVAFSPRASTVNVFEYILSDTEEIVSVEIKHLGSFRILGDEDKFIEPNESVERQCLVVLPRVSTVGYQLEFEVFAESGYSWRATTVAGNSAFEHNKAGDKS